MKRILKIIGIIAMVCLLPSLLALLFIVGGTAYDKFDNWRYDEVSKFESSKWKSDPKYRWGASRYVAENIIKNEMSKDEVRALLGEPSNLLENGSWQYYGERPGWRLVDFHGGGLVVGFSESETVASARDNTWID